MIGTYCEFNFSRQPSRIEFARRAVEYVDRQVPRLFNTLGVQIPNEKVQISFADISGGNFIIPRTLNVADNLFDKDLGCLTHECVHWVQQPNPQVYQQRQKIIEGVADYYRIVLSEDKQGDYFNDDKRNLVSRFELKDLYDSGSEFIAHLRRRSNNPQFVKELNDCLRTNNIHTIDQFFPERFGDSFDRLHSEYQRQRESIIGSPPHEVNRYSYFTDLA